MSGLQNKNNRWEAVLKAHRIFLKKASLMAATIIEMVPYRHIISFAFKENYIFFAWMPAPAWLAATQCSYDKIAAQTAGLYSLCE